MKRAVQCQGTWPSLLFSLWREKAGAAPLSNLGFVSFAMEDSRQSKEQRLNRLALVGSAPTKLRAMAPEHMGTCGSFWVMSANRELNTGGSFYSNRSVTAKADDLNLCLFKWRDHLADGAAS
jgi:hypothetical protein